MWEGEEEGEKGERPGDGDANEPDRGGVANPDREEKGKRWMFEKRRYSVGIPLELQPLKQKDATG